MGLNTPRYGWFLLSGSFIAAVLTRGKTRTHLLLVIVTLALLGLAPINTSLSDAHMLTMGVTLTLALLIPYLVLTFLFHDGAIQLTRMHVRHTRRGEIQCVVSTTILAYGLLPWLVLATGDYRNWTFQPGASDLIKLFMGLNGVGIWEELFFVATVLGLVRLSLPFIWANMAQAALWASFLYELGFRGWGPLVILPFALMQGYIYKRTGSLLYILTIHQIIDIILFLVLVHAHYPNWLPIFLT
jgi:membrane protease YdiL (CAAX protease family)